MTKICVILMSQTCRKFHNVAILSHRLSVFKYLFFFLYYSFFPYFIT
nr:MAG TPA: hypothetical protein [Caudoviricetes sp.]